MWSFVGNKEVKTWVWLALERTTRQIVGFATGDRGSYCGQMLWSSLPVDYQQKAIFYTDAWSVYDDLRFFITFGENQSICSSRRHHHPSAQ